MVTAQTQMRMAKMDCEYSLKAAAMELRHLHATVMEKYPHIQREDGLSDEQWSKRKDVVQVEKPYIGRRLGD